MKRWRWIEHVAIGAVIVTLAYFWWLTPAEVRERYLMRAVAGAGKTVSIFLPGAPDPPAIGPHRPPIGVSMADADSLFLADTDRGWKVICIENGRVRYNHAQMHYEHAMHPDLVRLRAEYQLDTVVASGNTDLERIVALMGWVAIRLPVGSVPLVRDYSPSWDVFQMLADAERGIGFICGDRSMALLQIATAMGFTMRGIALQRRIGNGHSLVEVWLDDRRQWVALDSYINGYYVMDDEPVHVARLHRAFRKGRSNDVILARDIGEFRSSDGVAFSRLGGLFQTFAYMMRLDLRSTIGLPHWHPRRNHVYSDILWAESDLDAKVHYAQLTDDLGFVYFPLNEVEIAVDTIRSSAGVLRLSFATETPNFCGFDVTLEQTDDSGTSSRLETMEDDYWDWVLPDKGSAEITIRTRNTAGRIGYPSRFAALATRSPAIRTRSAQ